MARSTGSNWISIGLVIGGMLGIAIGYALGTMTGMPTLWVAICFPIGCGAGLLFGLSQSLDRFNDRELCRLCGQHKRPGKACASGRCGRSD